MLTVLRLVIAFFYYLLLPKRRYPPSPLFVFLLQLVLLVATSWVYFIKTPLIEREMLAYSPLSAIEKKIDFPVRLYDRAYYEASAFVSQSTFPSLNDTFHYWPEKMKRFMFPQTFLAESLIATDSLIVTFPTSRDLWLYKGWILLLLNDSVRLDDATTTLLRLDPNHPHVQELVRFTSEQ